MQSESEFMSRAEAAKLAGVAIVTIDKWLREPGAPPRQVFRRRVQIPRREFVAWLKSQVQVKGPRP